MNILERIRYHAQKTPNKPAHIFKGETTSYGEIWEKSGYLSAYISKHFPRQQPIGVFGNKSKYMLISFLACTRSGNPYIPLDENIPDGRINQILNEAGSPILFSTLENRVPEVACDKINLTKLKEIIDLQETNNKDLEVKIDENFYILFTSGSTGTPKGVRILRSNLEDFVKWTSDAYCYDKKSYYFLNQAPFSFDLSVYELYNALTSGGCIVSLSSTQIKDLKVLKEVLEEHAAKIGVWVSTPSFLSLCVQDPSYSAKNYSSLYQFVLIGEVFPKPLAKEVLNRFPNSIVSNFYGPTEGTVAHTVIDLSHEIVDKYPALPIGRCKPRSEVIVDEDGEMILVGPNISPGYINDAERSARVFFAINGKQAYRTGDLGMQNSDGLLFFAGRKDFQVKLNGYRVELGDIERHLCSVSFIKDSCVVPKIQNGVVAWLCGFIVPREELPFASTIELRKAIRTELEKGLPAYMVPKTYIVLDRLPMTENGKVDRRALSKQLDEMQ